MAKYEDIANTLRTRIKSGDYPAGSFLPKQTELVTEFNVSRMTVQKAVEVLMMEGLVASKKGVGTTVLDHPFTTRDTSTLSEYEGLSWEMAHGNRQLTSQIIEFGVEFPDETVQEKLRLTEEEPVYKILRLRLVEDQPFVLEHTYMPLNLVPGMKKEILEHSIYHYIRQQLGLRISGAYRTIRADKPSDYDKLYLQAQPEDPILEISQIVYQQDGKPFEYSRSRNRYDVRDYSFLDMKGS